jgi:hypothetical protein
VWTAVDGCLQVTSSSLQQLLQLPALAELEVGEPVKSFLNLSDNGHFLPQHDHDFDVLDDVLDDLCASVKSAGRDFVIKISADRWSAEDEVQYIYNPNVDL